MPDLQELRADARAARLNMWHCARKHDTAGTNYHAEQYLRTLMAIKAAYPVPAR